MIAGLLPPLASLFIPDDKEGVLTMTQALMRHASGIDRD